MFWKTMVQIFKKVNDIVPVGFFTEPVNDTIM